MNYQLIFHEDYAISFMFIILGKRYKYLNKFALLHLIHTKSASNNYQENKKYFLSVLFVSNIICEYHLKNNPKDIVILINYIKLFIDCFRYGKIFYPDLFQNIINYIMKNEYLTLNKKIDIINNIATNSSLTMNTFYKYINVKAKKSNSIFNKSKTIINDCKNFYHISFIIYCNEFLYLRKTINSILEQLYINYEIIIIYDNIEVNDLYYIQNFIKKYTFITLLKNKNIKGILYSISLGVLKSIGQYILYLQSGYILFKENILNEIFMKVNNNIDILEFNLFINNNYFVNSPSLNLYKCLHVKSKINTESIKYNSLYKEIDQSKELLFNKLIKTDFFKNIINEYKFLKYQNCVYNFYDNILLFPLMNNNIKFMHIDTIGVIQNNKDIDELNLINIMKDKDQKIKDSIFYINFIFDNSNNTYEGKKYALNEFFNYLSIIYNRFNNISFDSHKLLEKFNNSKFINKRDKMNLNAYYNSLIN